MKPAIIKEICAKVVGQDHAVQHAVDRIVAGSNPLIPSARPIATLVFLGQSGVGKSQLVNSLAQAFGRGMRDSDGIYNPITIMGSDLRDRHDVAKIVGAPPGYVGYDQGGSLTKRVLQHPRSIVFFDEMEKAHPDCFNLLLGALENGWIEAADGSRVDFRNTVLIMAGNLGSDRVASSNRPKNAFGFGKPDLTDQDPSTRAREIYMDSFKKFFSPEMVGRIGESNIIIFNPLSSEHLREILRRQLAQLNTALKEQHGVQFYLLPETEKKIIELGSSSEHGARPMRDFVTQILAPALQEAVIAGNLPKGTNLRVDFDSADPSKLKITSVNPVAARRARVRA